MAEEELRAVIQANSEFATSLQTIMETHEKNTLLSSISIHSVLLLMSQGPWFYNKTNINHTLRLHNLKRPADHYKYILALFNSIRDVDFSLANKAFLKDNYQLEELFKTSLTNNFLYDIHPMDFSRNAPVAKLINDWIEDRTGRKVKNLVNGNNLNEPTCLALLNVMYFSGKWAKPFNGVDTVPATFYLNDTETTTVQMMRMKSEFYYKCDIYKGFQILQLPFVNDDISLVFILPHPGSKWNFANSILFHDLTSLTENMSKQEVDVSLPKFTMEETMDLKTYLSQMGLDELFSTNLFNVINGEEVNLDKINQKVFIDVNENGAEIGVGTVSHISKADEKRDVSNNSIVIYEMNVKTDISNRFAKTNVVWRTKNIDKYAKEAVFKVILTETAFITEFVMEIEGKSYKSYIKEKEEAKVIYNQALARGQSAGLVEAKTRDSKEFSVSVNLKPESTAAFYLCYEELLQRIHDQYELVLNICPSQIVKNLSVEVYINESSPLKFVKTPPLRSGNDLARPENEAFLNPSSEINVVNLKTATVKFNPDAKTQRILAHHLGSKASEGLSGQFVVQYEVERDPQNGQILLQDGYFAHFFAPNDLDPLPKHVVFVLDTSGSMGGRKIIQLQDAMLSILNEIRKNDIVNIIDFGSDVVVWDINSGTKTILPFFNNVEDYEDPYNKMRNMFLPEPTYANEETIKKAKDVVRQLTVFGSTYMIGGLNTALYLVKVVQDKVVDKGEKYQPIIIFLTDGQPNVGISSTDRIVEIVTRLNSRHNKASIFSLSFGYGAEKSFLRKLSLKNGGFSRHIYEAADASLQLQAFYKQISSPLLANIEFKYDSEVEEVTKTCFPIYFSGSELIVSGRYRDVNFPTFINCWGPRGPIIIQSVIERPVTSLERLWAYLTVKQLLDEKEIVDDKAELTRKAIAIALKYSFVTDVTSLVVVKPDEATAVDNTPDPGDFSLFKMHTNSGNVFGQVQLQGQRNKQLASGSFVFGSAQPIPTVQFGSVSAQLPSSDLFGSPSCFSSNLPMRKASSSRDFSTTGYMKKSGPPQQSLSAQFGTGFGQTQHSGVNFKSSIFESAADAQMDYSTTGYIEKPLQPQQPLSAQFGSGFGQTQHSFSELNFNSNIFGSAADAQMPQPSSGGFNFTARGFQIGTGNQHVGDFGGMEITEPTQDVSTTLDKKGPEEFLANRPFLIILQLKKENKVITLLNGRIYNPLY